MKAAGCRPLEKKLRAHIPSRKQATESNGVRHYNLKALSQAIAPIPPTQCHQLGTMYSNV